MKQRKSVPQICCSKKMYNAQSLYGWSSRGDQPLLDSKHLATCTNPINV